MFVKPAPGRKVRHPKTKRPIPADGVRVPDDKIYWVRRLRSGDVVQVDSPVNVKAEVQKSIKRPKAEV